MKRLILAGSLLLWTTIAAADLETVRAAAEAGSVEAQFELGELYEFGFRMPDHAVHAFAWYSLAAERGSAKAAQRRDLIKAKLDAGQLSAAEREHTELAAKVPMPKATPAPAPGAESHPAPPAAEPTPPPAATPTSTNPVEPNPTNK